MNPCFFFFPLQLSNVLIFYVLIMFIICLPWKGLNLRGQGFLFALFTIVFLVLTVGSLVYRCSINISWTLTTAFTQVSMPRRLPGPHPQLNELGLLHVTARENAQHEELWGFSVRGYQQEPGNRTSVLVGSSGRGSKKMDVWSIGCCQKAGAYL